MGGEPIQSCLALDRTAWAAGAPDQEPIWTVCSLAIPVQDFELYEGKMPGFVLRSGPRSRKWTLPQSTRTLQRIVDRADTTYVRRACPHGSTQQPRRRLVLLFLFTRKAQTWLPHDRDRACHFRATLVRFPRI